MGGGYEGVVRHDDLEEVIGDAAEPIAQQRDLLVRDATVDKSQRARRVDTQHGHLGIDVQGVHVSGNVAAPSVQGQEEPAHGIVQGDVVVARHDDLGAGDSLEEAPGSQELPAPGPLGEIAAHGDQCRLEPAQIGEQLPDEERVLAAEVQIRYVGKPPHDAFRLKEGSQFKAIVV
jgi:hypothetical protein